MLGLRIEPSEKKSTWLNILESLNTQGVKDVVFIIMDRFSGIEEEVNLP